MAATCPPAEPGPGCSLHGTPGRSQGKDRCLQPGLGAQHFHRSVGGGKPSGSRGGPPLREGTPTPAGRRPAASQTVGKSCSEDKAGSFPAELEGCTLPPLRLQGPLRWQGRGPRKWSGNGEEEPAKEAAHPKALRSRDAASKPLPSRFPGPRRRAVTALEQSSSTRLHIPLNHLGCLGLKASPPTFWGDVLASVFLRSPPKRGLEHPARVQNHPLRGALDAVGIPWELKMRPTPGPGSRDRA